MGGSLSNQRFVAHFQTSDWLTFGLTKTKNIRWNDAASCNRYSGYIKKDIIFLNNYI